MRTPMIRIFVRGARRIARRTLGRFTVAVVVTAALVAVSCGDSDSPAGPADTSATVDDSTTTTSTSSTTTTPVTTAPVTTATITTTTTEPPTLEERIAANMQGAQREYLDIWGEQELEVVFFHRGDWASEVTDTHLGTGRYCERGTYAWSVTEAKSESEFTIHYDALTEDPDCAAFGIERLTAVFTGSREVDGRLVYDFGYTAGLGTPEQPVTGTRTVCSDQWDDPEPCGLPDPGSVISAPPN